MWAVGTYTLLSHNLSKVTTWLPAPSRSWKATIVLRVDHDYVMDSNTPGNGKATTKRMPEPWMNSWSREACLPCTYHFWTVTWERKWSIWFELLTFSISLLQEHTLADALTDIWLKHLRGFFFFSYKKYSRLLLVLVWHVLGCQAWSLCDSLELSSIKSKRPLKLELSHLHFWGRWGRREKQVEVKIFFEIPSAQPLPFDQP